MRSHTPRRFLRARSRPLPPTTAYSLGGTATKPEGAATSLGGTATTTESPEPIAVRRLTHDETEFAAWRHAEALPHGLFPSLGIGFLTRYYASFVDSPYAVALVASFEGRPVGVLAGTVANGEHYRWVLRRRGASLAGSAMAALAVRPRTAAYFLRTRTGHYARAIGRLATDQLRGKGPGTDEQRGGPGADEQRGGAGSDEQRGRGPGAHEGEHGASGAGRTDTETRAGPPGVLTHVLVADEVRGRGVGSTLLDAFVAITSQHGSGELVLVTAVGEDGAGGFYARHGWSHRADRYDWDGREVAVYGLPLR